MNETENMTSLPSIIALGVDPAPFVTGICLVEWRPVSGLVRVLRSATISPLACEGIQDFLDGIDLDQAPTVAGIEAAFISPANIGAGLDIAHAGGFCEFLPSCMFPGIHIHRLQAVVWRRLIFGVGGNLLKTKAAKDHCRNWLEQHITVENMSEHEVEAVAIACAACEKETNHAR